MDVDTNRASTFFQSKPSRKTVLQEQTNIESSKKLYKEQEEYEESLDNYSGDDPLIPFWNYIMWLERNHMKLGLKDRYTSLLKNTVIRFKDCQKYHQDYRFVRITIKYVTTHPNSAKLYKMLSERGIGTTYAEFFKSWAEVLEKNNDFKGAYRVFQKGIESGAKPVKDLQEACTQFQLRFSVRMLTTDSPVKMHSASQKQISQSNGKILSNVENESNLSIPFVQKQVGPKNDAHGYSSPAKKSLQYNSDPPSSIRDCNNDNNIQRRKSKMKKEFNCPVAIFEEPNPKIKPMYPKHLVYADGRDTQLEEIRAAAYWKRVEQEEERKKSSTYDEDIFGSLSTSHNENVESYHSGTQKEEYTSKEKLPEPKELMECQNSEIHCTSNSPIGGFSMINNHNLSTSITVNTRAAMNVIQQMWTSPSPRGCRIYNEDDSLFKHPAPKPRNMSIPFAVFSDEDNFNVFNDSDLNSATKCKTINPPSASLNVFSNEESTKLAPKDAPNDLQFDVFKDEPELPVSAVKGNNEKAVEVNILQPTVEKIPVFVDEDDDLAMPLSEDNQERRKSNFTVRKMPPLKYVAPPDGPDPPLESEDKENQPPKSYSTPTEKRPLSGVLVPSTDIPVRDFNDTSDEDSDDDKVRKNINFDDITCNTRAFSNMLPSSTPFTFIGKKRMSVTSSLLNGSYVSQEMDTHFTNSKQIPVTTTENLSMILEASKERYSSSSGSSSGASNKTFTLSEKKSLAIIREQLREEEEEGDAEISAMLKNDEDGCLDPFTENITSFLLRRIHFPQSVHSIGYNRIYTSMPLIKLSSTIKLGDEKWTIAEEIGKGSYARVLKAYSVNKSFTEPIVLKYQRPACKWEWYIVKELHSRLQTNDQKNYFLNFKKAFVYSNGSIITAKYAQYGTILDLVNKLKLAKMDKWPIAVCVLLHLQMITAVEYLHSCQIIHGDIKPDNFVICSLPNLSKPCVQLIDFGRSIDMRLYPPNTQFTKVVETDGFTCHEMRDNKPWTYQTDLYGLAGTMYLLLMGDYMKTIKRDNKWTLQKPLLRNMRRDILDPIFHSLLNVPSSSELPNLASIKDQLNILLASENQMQYQLMTTTNLLNRKYK